MKTPQKLGNWKVTISMTPTFFFVFLKYFVRELNTPPYLKKQLYGPFLWMGFDCLKAAEQLRGGSLLITTKFPEIPGTHLINFGKMKGWVDFELGTPGLGIQCLNH